MGLSSVQQLEAFAYWRRRVLTTAAGRRLWSLDAATETRLMQQAPLYVLAGQQVDLYAEAVLAGKARVDLSAQYFAKAFVLGNLLPAKSVAQEGEFFHYYARELAQCRPQVLDKCTLYLEADIGEQAAQEVAVFINLAGSVADMLLPKILQYRGRSAQYQFIAEVLAKLKPWCAPWHFGFMESRADKAVRLVLILKAGLQNLHAALQASGAPQLTQAAQQLLRRIDELQIFHYMLDLDVLPDGRLGDTIGLELLPEKAVTPTRQQLLLQSAAFQRFVELLRAAELADERLDALSEAVFSAAVAADTYLYSRISHFKLRWQSGRALPAKVYVQLRSVRRQRCVNEALGYTKVAIDAEGEKHE